MVDESRSPKPHKPTRVREPDNTRPPDEPTPKKPTRPESAEDDDTDIQTEGM